MAMTKKKSSQVYCPYCAANNGDGPGQEKLKAVTDAEGNEVTEDMIEIQYKVINPSWIIMSVAICVKGLPLQEKVPDNSPAHYKYVCHVCKYGENHVTFVVD